MAGTGKEGKATVVQGGSASAPRSAAPTPGKATLTPPSVSASGSASASGAATAPARDAAADDGAPRGIVPFSQRRGAISGPSTPPPGSRKADPRPQVSVEGYKTAEEARENLENPTWDPNASYEGRKPTDKPGAWVEANAVRNAPEAKSVNMDRELVDKRMVAGTTVDASKASANLAAGSLSKAELAHITVDQVAQVNPLGEQPKAILKGPLSESWHTAKHELLHEGEDVENNKARRMLMAKLWEFRQWHHNLILQRTQADPDIGKEGLSDWKAAGSTTLTSDIDVNLKGNKTEQAVGKFNKKFKEDGFTKEAGVVYDVNVYALDFMHKDTFKGLAEEDGKVKKHDFGGAPKPGQGPAPEGAASAAPTRVSAKEGAREGAEGGGVTADNPMLSDRMVKADAGLQRVWSLVKLRLYMTPGQWAEYIVNASVPADTAQAVDARYTSYIKELEAKMLGDAPELKAAEDLTKTGFQQLDATATRKAAAQADGKGDGEDVKMAASNRLYEEKLVQIATLRDRISRQITERRALFKTAPEDAEGMGAAIEGNLAILRDLISEAAMYSNEAYVTDGAVNHVVVGLQEKIGISQTGAESKDAFNENVADVLKEVARHSATVGEAAYKAGKYIWRMADAAKNIGSKDKDIAVLYDIGYKLANEIKGGDATQEQLEAKAEEAIKAALGAKAATPAALMAFIREVGARVAKEISNKDDFKRTAPVQATKKKP